MAAVLVSTKEGGATSSFPSYRLVSAEYQAARLLDTQLQRLVERAAALMEARWASLAVLDPVSQTLSLLAACSQGFSGLPPASLRVHEELARWVTREQAPAIIADGANDPRTRALGNLAVGSLLSVPLLAGQEVLGALTLSSPSINTFRPHQLRLLELVADLGALALFQARHFEAMTQQSQQLTRLLEVACELGTALDPGTLMGLTVSALRQLIHCEEAVVYRYEADTQTLCGVAGLGTHSSRLADERIRMSDPQSVTAWVAQQRRPLLHSGGARGFVGRATGALLAHRELALLAVPLVAREQLWGVITLARAAPFEPGDLRTLLTLSQLIAPALVQARNAR